MAKKKSNSRKSAGGAGKAPSRDTYEDEEVDDSRLTLEALDAISTDSEDEGRGGGSKDEWDAEAAALRRAIAEGAFDRIGMNVEKKKNKGKKQKGSSKNDEDSDDSEDDGGEDVVLEDESSDEEEEEEAEGGDASDSSDAGDDIAAQRKAELERMQKTSAGKALRVVGDELSAAHSAMPWSETFTVVPSNPLPFGGVDGSALDVHDDLKREVAFYNTAMEGVIEARALCERSGIAFRRPDDFFAEMVKTDDHMAKVKDRLIFETKKMEAFEQRKSNKEQRLRAKEARANKAIEKARAKKDHMKAVDDWAKDAAANRIPGAIRDDDDYQLSRVSGGGGPNKKRERADAKYGHGGKRGRFKQNDAKTLNDMSGFNPRGNFGGIGTKSGKHKSGGGAGGAGGGGGGGGGGAGANRKGKRARDAARSRR